MFCSRHALEEIGHTSRPVFGQPVPFQTIIFARPLKRKLLTPLARRHRFGINLARPCFEDDAYGAAKCLAARVVEILQELAGSFD